MPNRKQIAEFWNRANNRCWFCGYDDIGDLERCHIIARCEGGADDASNLQILCSICHRKSEYWHPHAKLEEAAKGDNP